MLCMDDTLQQIGLNQKEAEFYLYLLQHGPQTTLQLTKATGEKRTNVYMILDSLIQKGVVAADDSKSSRLFSAQEPSSLQKLLVVEQQRQKQAVAALSAAMPELKSLHALTSDKPGVVHLAGIDGFKSILNDMKTTGSDVLLVGSNEILNQPEIYDVLLKSLHERKALGIHTKAIFELANRPYIDKVAFAERGFEVRFLGKHAYPGEMAIYDNNLLLTTFRPSLINTVVTSDDVATTMRLLFEELWQKAKP